MRVCGEVWHTLRTIPRPIQSVFNVQVSITLSRVSRLSVVVADSKLTARFVDRLVPDPVFHDYVDRRDLRHNVATYIILRTCRRATLDPRRCNESGHDGNVLPFGRLARHVDRCSSAHRPDPCTDSIKNTESCVRQYSSCDRVRILRTPEAVLPYPDLLALVAFALDVLDGTVRRTTPHLLHGPLGLGGHDRHCPDRVQLGLHKLDPFRRRQSFRLTSPVSNRVRARTHT